MEINFKDYLIEEEVKDILKEELEKIKQIIITTLNDSELGQKIRKLL